MQCVSWVSASQLVWAYEPLSQWNLCQRLWEKETPCCATDLEPEGLEDFDANNKEQAT